jgi:hypothetical protein
LKRDTAHDLIDQRWTAYHIDQKSQPSEATAANISLDQNAGASDTSNPISDGANETNFHTDSNTPSKSSWLVGVSDKNYKR